MPIHLPPLSRRKFLARALSAGAAVAASPNILAALRSTERDSWALLADIHLAADREKMARGINMAEHFTTVTREIVSLPKPPAGLFIVGDCAFNSGESGDYGTLIELLKPMREDKTPI